MGQGMDRRGWLRMLENDGVLFWKHATRKKWSEKHAVRKILRIVYKICSVESADGVCNDSVWYACAWYCTAARDVCAAPRDVCAAPGHAIFRNGECRGLLQETCLPVGHDCSMRRSGIVWKSVRAVFWFSGKVQIKLFAMVSKKWFIKLANETRRTRRISNSS